jgi:hypothetical protein
VAESWRLMHAAGKRSAAPTARVRAAGLNLAGECLAVISPRRQHRRSAIGIRDPAQFAAKRTGHMPSHVPELARSRSQRSAHTTADLRPKGFHPVPDEMRALPVKSDVLELWMQPICSIAGRTNSSVTCSNQPNIQDESPYLTEYQGISRADNLSRADATYGTVSGQRRPTAAGPRR